MDIIVKGRRTGVSPRFRRHVETKLARLAKWERKGMSVDVEVSEERKTRLANQRERVELTIHSSGPVIRGEASAGDRYAALDLAVDRVEARLRKLADRRKIHRGNHAPVSVAAATAGLPAMDESAPSTVPAPTAGTAVATAAPADTEVNATDRDATAGETSGGDTTAAPARADDSIPDDLVELDTQGDGPIVVREKFHYAKPMTIDRALFEMELVGHDFYLFRDEERDAPSVVYRRKGFNYGVLRLME